MVSLFPSNRRAVIKFPVLCGGVARDRISRKPRTTKNRKVRKLVADGNTKFEISLKNDEVSKLDGNSITVFSSFSFFFFCLLLAKEGFVISASMVE